MAIVSIKEVHEGRGGDYTAKSRKSIRRHTRAFRVVTNAATDTSYDVLAYCPALGSLHPVDVGAWCVGKRATQDSKSKLVWNCTVEYSSEKELHEDPTDDPTEFEWDTDARKETFHKDRNGDAILNSAGEPFITGIDDEVSLWTITATKNLAVVPAAILSYRDAVNSDNIILDGIPFASDKLKIKKIHISKLQSRNDIFFRELQIVFKAQDSWKRKIIEQGLNQKVSSKLKPCFEDTDGTIKARKPMPLAANGTQLAVPLSGPSAIIWKTVDLRSVMAFMSLPIDLSTYLSP